MRVLFVSSGTTNEGIGSLVWEQGESLKAKGIVIEYFTIKDKGISGYLRHIFKLKNHLNKNQYDIIHAHYGLSGLIAILANRKRIKLIISFMGNDLLGDHARNGKSTFVGKFLVSINQLFAKYADHIIVKNQVMSTKITHKNISVIPNGLDLNLFYSMSKSYTISKIGWDKEVSNLLFMSDPEKPEKNYNLTKSALLQLENYNYQVHFLKDIPHNEVVNYYNASVVCLLSSYHEGSPNVIKEAMACNCPVVATDVGDIKWLIGEIPGYYLASFDLFDFADKIKLALEFSSQYGKTKGRERIIELGLDSETVAGNIIEIYNKVLNLES